MFGGDELTWHSISYHDHNPALPNPSRELEISMPILYELYKLFPKAYVLESNHGSLVYRKQVSTKMPREVFKDYNQILRAPKTWRWVPDLMFKVGPKQDVYVCHGRNKDVTKLSQMLGVSAVQFHYHENYKIEYWQSNTGLRFAMQCGCLIDHSAKDFDYSRLNLKTPIIGTGVIVNGHPELVPLLVDKHGEIIL